MAIKKYDVCARTGSYIDANGVEKSRWLNVGVVFESEKGLSLKLEALPVGGEWAGWLSLFEPRDANSQRPPQRPTQKADKNIFDDESPPF